MNVKSDLNIRNSFKNIDYNKPELTAAIGENSGLSLDDRDLIIIEGYRKSVEIIYDSILNQYENVDTLVYPIYFCSRHSIELHLKMIIRKLIWLCNYRKIDKDHREIVKNAKNTLKMHSINLLVNSMKELSSLQKETQTSFDGMENFELYVDAYYFDVDAVAGRYTFSRGSSDSTLGERVQLNVELFYDNFREADHLLDNFHNDCINLVLEFQTATFTKKLSRVDIEEISKIIRRDRFEKFAEEKAMVISKFKLSNRDFSKAINIIKEHREFSSNAGVEIKFGDISENTLKNLAEINASNYLEKKLRGKYPYFNAADPYSDYSKSELEFVIELNERTKLQGDKLLKEVTYDEILVIRSIQELSFTNFSENLDLIYAENVKIGNYKGNPDYLINKLKELDTFLIGAKMSGQITYSSIFKRYYDEELEFLKREFEEIIIVFW